MEASLHVFLPVTDIDALPGRCDKAAAMKVVCERKALLWLPDHVAYRQEQDIAPQIERRALQAILAEKLHARGKAFSSDSSAKKKDHSGCLYLSC